MIKDYLKYSGAGVVLFILIVLTLVCHTWGFMLADVDSDDKFLQFFWIEMALIVLGGALSSIVFE